jgi:adenylosuccinate synthase
MVRAIVGANWGDEGKGKMTDMLAAQSDMVIRFQGGSNAGHTIVNEHGKFALHLLPSGIFFPHITNLIGPGVAFCPEDFFKELESVKARGIEPNIKVSDRAQILMPYHRMFDTLEEQRLGKASFGSTKSGIAPFYSDKYAKIGIQLSELSFPEVLEARVHSICTQKNVILDHLYGAPLLKEKDLLATLQDYAERMAPYLVDGSALVHEALSEGKNLLLEGQLGSLRDPDHGIYPYTTSSSTLAGYGAVGAGVPSWAIKSVLAVTKAYSSCVGAGPFVGELMDEVGDELRNRGGDGGEYGATTGRPRRMAWFDCVASRYGCRVQGATEVALTALDVLGYLDKIPVCVAYEMNGKRLHDFPATAIQYHCKPVYEHLDGWKCDIRNIRRFEDLPENAQKYVLFVEKAIGIPVRFVSVGPKREEIIER